MGKLEDKITRAAHIKRHTVGTSNEISFSVLDAAKQALDSEDAGEEKRGPLFGRITLFTLPGRHKKPIATPTKARGLHLSTGDFVSVDEDEPPVTFGVIGSDAASGTAGRDARRAANAAGALEAGRATPAASAKTRSAARSPEEEIARRKARRRLSRIVGVAVVAVVSVGLLGAGGAYLYQDYLNHQENVGQLDDSIGLVSQTDATLHVLDDVVEHPFEEGAAEKRAALEEQLDAASSILADADGKARAASADLRASRDKEAANQVVAAIAARRTLIETGAQLVAASASAQQCADHMDAAWSHLLEADELARTAAALVAETTVEHVQASKDATNQALAALESARDELDEAEAAYAEADLSAVSAYIDKRVEALGYALASDDAFLARDKVQAAAQNDAYNVADAEAAALAEQLPSEPSSVVFHAYESATGELRNAYSTARSQAGTADAFIRDYLGAASK